MIDALEGRPKQRHYAHRHLREAEPGDTVNGGRGEDNDRRQPVVTQSLVIDRASVATVEYASG